MKIRLGCNSCPANEEGRIPSLLLPINDTGYYEYVCEKGHENAAGLCMQPFELLLVNAGFSFLDGYYRECVFNLASALERFYEFCSKIILAEMDTWGREDKNAKFKTTWDWVKNQSERQLGAFLFLYLAHCKEPAPFKDLENQTKFRNKVIHKGYFPEEKEAITYGEAVFEFIRAVAKKLCPHPVIKDGVLVPQKFTEIFTQQQRAHQEMGHQQGLSTCINFIPGLLQQDSLREFAGKPLLGFVEFIKDYDRAFHRVFGKDRKF